MHYTELQKTVSPTDNKTMNNNNNNKKGTDSPSIFLLKMGGEKGGRLNLNVCRNIHSQL